MDSQLFLLLFLILRDRCACCSLIHAHLPARKLHLVGMQLLLLLLEHVMSEHLVRDYHGLGNLLGCSYISLLKTGKGKSLDSTLRILLSYLWVLALEAQTWECSLVDSPRPCGVRKDSRVAEMCHSFKRCELQHIKSPIWPLHNLRLD